jgi:hypothetical protein
LRTAASPLRSEVMNMQQMPRDPARAEVSRKYVTFGVMPNNKRATVSVSLARAPSTSFLPTADAAREAIERPVSARPHRETTWRPSRPGSSSCVRRGRRLRSISPW